MTLLLLLCSSQANIQYGSIPDHIITNFDRNYNDALIRIRCDGVEGVVHKYYISDGFGPRIITTIETLRDSINFKFVIETFSNYMYLNYADCIILKINNIINGLNETINNIGPYYITELNDDTYFILHKHAITIKEFISINKNNNLFVEFYNTTHVGIRWHRDDIVNEYE